MKLRAFKIQTLTLKLSRSTFSTKDILAPNLDFLTKPIF